MQRPGNLSGGNWKDLALKASRCELWIYPIIHLLLAVFSGSFLSGPTRLQFSESWQFWIKNINFTIRKKRVLCYSWGYSGVGHSWRLTGGRVHVWQVTSQSQELCAECIFWLFPTPVLLLAANTRAVDRSVNDMFFINRKLIYLNDADEFKKCNLKRDEHDFLLQVKFIFSY